MKRSSWISYASALLALLALFASYALQLDPANRGEWGWGESTIYLLNPWAWGIGLGAGVALIVGQLGQVLLAGPAYRKKVIQAVIDVLVEECPGRNKENQALRYEEWVADIRTWGNNAYRGRA